MKQVLIIAYHYPPRPGIGSQRPYRLAKYFPFFGWRPLVLTAELPGKPPEGINVIETKYNDIISSLKTIIGFNPEKGMHEQLGMPDGFCAASWKSRFIKQFEEIIAFPERERGWIKYAFLAGSKIINSEPIDIIISSSPPVSTHLIANKLKEIYRKAWVADFRDLWTQHQNYSKIGIIKKFERCLEVRTLARADAMVTISPPLAEYLRFLHKDKQVFCVTNGFDPDEFLNKSTNMTKKFTITYTGTIYNQKMKLSLLFEGVSELINEGRINKDMIEILFFTSSNNHLFKEAKKYKLNGIVRQCGLIPRSEVLEKQRESQILLLLLWNDENYEGVIPAKIFEYIAAARPIIAIGGPGGCVRKLLEETKSGNYINDIEKMKRILIDYYQEFCATGGVNNNGESNIENYSYFSITQRYSNILNNIIN